MGESKTKPAPDLREPEGLRQLLEEQAGQLRAADKQLIREAYLFSEQAHQGMLRKSGRPYFHHCLETARLLGQLRFDAHTMAAGLLHDVLEDTEFTYEELRERFPQPVCDLVDGVTKISALKFRTSREQQVENLRKMMISMTRDIRVIVIKLCDRLHNMRTLRHLPPKKRLAISHSTMDIYAPLASRLGMERIKTDLEDLAMRYLHPEEYRKIDRYLNKNRKERERVVQASVEVLRRHLVKAGFAKVSVTGRSKHYYGIHRKMQRQMLDIEDLCDLTAIRVLCDTKQQCYEIMGRIHALWPSVPGKFDDYISMPKKNGYKSIHTTVIGVSGQVTEIQIRTHEMHQINEDGIAAHWKYKEGITDSSARLERRLVWLRRLIGWLTEIEDPSEFMASLKESVAQESLFCFTPEGDVIEVPLGATPLDFAFQIHTEVGLTCTGAKINNRMAPLRRELKNGDMVEIITSKSGHPSQGWLEIVKTSRARNKIKHWMKTQNFDEHMRWGKDSLQRALKARKGSWTLAEVMEKLEAKCKAMRFASVNDILMEIGFGSVSAQSILDRLNPQRQSRTKKAQHTGSTSGVLVADTPGAEVRFAGCCSPLPGDEIVGYITIGRGVSIHKKECRGLASLIAGRGEEARLIEVDWDRAHLPMLKVGFRVSGRDRPTILHDVLASIRAHSQRIISTSSRSDKKGGVVMRFQIHVPGKSQVDALIQELKIIEDVSIVDQISAKPEEDA